MKTALRIVIILVASAIISGITWVIVEAGEPSSTVESTGEGYGVGRQQRVELSEGELSEEELPRRGMGGGRYEEALEGEFSGIETIRNFVIVTVLVAVVALIEFMLQKRRKRRLLAASRLNPADPLQK
jgi:hypothetical protein